MQLKIALRALPVGIESRNQHGATIRAARPRDRAYHARCARAEMVGGSTRTALRRFALRSFFLFPLFRVTIAAMAVLAIHKRLRPPVSTDCHFSVHLHN